MPRFIHADFAEGSQLALAADTTASSFTALAAVATLPADAKPLNDGEGSQACDAIVLMALATGADNVTGSVEVVGWSYSAIAALWIPKVRFRDDFTASGFTILIGGTTYRVADTFGTPTEGIANVDYEISSSITDQPGDVLVKMKGASHYQILGIKNSATAVNALARRK